jgi:hypothetical protein
MQKKTIFIASSTPAIPLAEDIAQYIERRLKSGVQIKRWWKKQFRLGKTLFDSLAKHTTECDFAIVLLTKDDYAEKKGRKLVSPRDNTIFELGLFAGELGIERCFMVCNTKAIALPSDVEGVLRSDISPNLNLKRAGDRTKAVEKVGPEIMDALEVSKCFDHPRLPLISRVQLGELEKPTPNGTLKLEASTTAVIVNSLQPVEQNDPPFCLSVQANLKSNAQYEYYFGDFGQNVSRTVTLIVKIAAAGPALQQLPLPERLEAIKANLECMRDNLSIHFRKRPPLQFCVHNATSGEDAVCYLRCHGAFQENFVRWAEKREAMEIAKELSDSCITPTKESSIFHSTRDVELSVDALFAGTNGFPASPDPKLFVPGDKETEKLINAMIDRREKRVAVVEERRETVRRTIKNILPIGLPGVPPKSIPEEFYQDVYLLCLGAYVLCRCACATA